MKEQKSNCLNQQLIYHIPYQEYNQTLHKHRFNDTSAYDYPTIKKIAAYNPQTQIKKQEFLKQYNTFKFDAFDISKIKNEQSCSKPQPFMGAFTQTQFEFKCFDLNVRVPSMCEFVPFSRILDQGSIQTESLDDILFGQQIGKSNIQKASESVYNEEISQIDEISQIQQLKQSNIGVSFFQSYDQFLNNNIKTQNNQRIMWDQSLQIKTSHVYQMHQSKDISFINQVDCLKNLYVQEKYTLSEQQLARKITEMFQGIENQVFTLDYAKLQWRFNEESVKIQHVLKYSFQKKLNVILQMANKKSRIQTALQYIKHQSYRRIFQQVGAQVKQILLITEQICLQTLARNAPLTDFIISLQQTHYQLSLIYEMLINQKAIALNQQKTYMDIDYSFLNSQAVIYIQIMKLASLNDNLGGRTHQFSLNLLSAVFKPITCTLNKIVFQETIQISNRDETYLRFYFDKLKEIVQFLGQRIDHIKHQSNELYLICRQKLDLQLVTDTQNLQQYNYAWKRIFRDKRKQIEQLRQRDKKKQKQERQKIHDIRVKQIYALKQKLYNKVKQQKRQRSQIYEESMKQAQRLKNQIMQRQQKRRLNYLIQKQQEKGYLLQAQLNQKRKLIKKKQELLEEAERLSLKIVQEKQNKKQGNQSQDQNLNKTQKSQEIELTKNGTSYDQIVKSEQKQSRISDNSFEDNKEHIQIANRSKYLNNKDSQHKNTGSKLRKMKSLMLQNIQIQSLNISHSSSSQSQNSQSEQQQLITKQIIQQQQQEQLHVNTNTVLSICIDNIIYQQMQITYLAMSYLVYQRYKISSIIDFMKKIFLSEQGDNLNQFLALGIDNDSAIDLKYFAQCQLFDKCDENILKLQPNFYTTHSYHNGKTAIYSSKKINIFHENLQSYIGFQFGKIPALLQPYLSYIHLGKYMQIFNSLIRIQHSRSIISKCLLSLNQHKKQIFFQKDTVKIRILNKLFVTRQMIEAFINTYNIYLTYRVIQKQIKRFKVNLKAEKLNKQLSQAHLLMLDNIIRLGLIDNSVNDITKILRQLFSKVRQFKNIVDLFCGDDLPNYMRDKVQQQIDSMRSKFKREQKFMESLFFSQQ